MIGFSQNFSDLIFLSFMIKILIPNSVSVFVKVVSELPLLMVRMSLRVLWPWTVPHQGRHLAEQLSPAVPAPGPAFSDDPCRPRGKVGFWAPAVAGPGAVGV